MSTRPYSVMPHSVLTQGACRPCADRSTLSGAPLPLNEATRAAYPGRVRLRLARLIVTLTLCVLACGVIVVNASWAHPHEEPWSWPTGEPRPVVADFDPPEHDWLAGNRGVVLDVALGEVIRSPAAGTVTFAGRVVDRDVVVVTHDERRSTFEPVTPSVHVGDVVAAGDPLGVVSTGPNGPLHWGVKIGSDRYLYPLLFVSGPVVLKPWDGPGDK